MPKSNAIAIMHSAVQKTTLRELELCDPGELKAPCKGIARGDQFQQLFAVGVKQGGLNMLILLKISVK